MTVHPRSLPLRATLAALLGVAAALLISCSGSGKGLIPSGDAGPLREDFRAVVEAAENGDGNCASTETALVKTEQDYDALPSSTDAGLRKRLQEGIANLRTRALDLCRQPVPQPTVTTTPPKTTTTQTTQSTPTNTQTTNTQTTPPTTTPAPSGPGGGTPAPGEEGAPEEETPGIGKGEGGGKDHNGPGGAGGQEAGK